MSGAGRAALVVAAALATATASAQVGTGTASAPSSPAKKALVQRILTLQQSERNGKVVAATLVRPSDEIMLITDRGVLVRTRVSEIRELGRATQGVTLIALDDGSQLSGLQRIVENDAGDVTDTDTDPTPSNN